MRTRLAIVVALLVTIGSIGFVVGAAGANGAADGDCTFPVTMTDDTGIDVTVEEEPETVVTLNPSAAQTMWEIGAEEKVIGVTKHAMNLEGAEERTNVSVPGETIDVETVVDLDPDLVLAPNVVPEEIVEQLREAGLTVYHFPSEESIEDVHDKTRTIGALAGECDGAEETVERMQHEVEVVEQAVEGEERPSALYVFYGFTAGEDTFIHEIITAAGADNVAAEAGIEGYQQVSEEVVVEEDPDWIVLNSDDDQVPDSESYESTTAVEEDQIVVVDTNYLNRPAPRIVHAITQLAQAFHPEAYEEARAELETTPTATESQATPTSEGTRAPGLGALAAVVALLIATTVARKGDGRP